jgi:hypothetical protein
VAVRGHLYFAASLVLQPGYLLATSSNYYNAKRLEKSASFYAKIWLTQSNHLVWHPNVFSDNASSHTGSHAWVTTAVTAAAGHVWPQRRIFIDVASRLLSFRLCVFLKANNVIAYS